MSVRTKLTILLLIVPLPLVVLASLQTYERYVHARDAEYAATGELARTGALLFLDVLDEAWNNEYILGSAIAFSSDQQTAERVIATHGRHTESPASWHWLGWIARTGAVLASSGAQPEYVSTSFLNEVLARMQSGEDRFVSDLMVDESDSHMAFVVARAIRTGGRLQGVMVGAIDTESLAGALTPISFDEARVYGLADSKGRIVYRSQANDIDYETRLMKAKGPAVRALEERRTVEVERFRSTVDDMERTGSAVYLDSIEWVSYAISSVHDVYAAAWRTTRRDIGILGFTVSAALSLGIVWGHRILSAPLVKLQQAATAIGRGDRTVRANLDGGDEVAATAQAFDAMADQLMEVEETRRRMIHAAVHELRNPLTTIRATIQLLQLQSRKGADADTLVRTAGRVIDQVDQANDGLNDILAAFETDEDGLQREDFRLVPLLRDTIEAFEVESTIGGRHTFRTLGLDENADLVIHGDSRRMRQVFRNLLSNACKYSPPGSRITVAVEVRPHERVVVSVADQGAGISEEDQNRIFESFFRAGVSGPDPGGMGLGLYVCRRLVNLHGGRIWVESAPGDGSTFYVSLPQAPRAG